MIDSALIDVPVAIAFLSQIRVVTPNTALSASHGSVRGNHVWDNAANIR